VAKRNSIPAKLKLTKNTALFKKLFKFIVESFFFNTVDFCRIVSECILQQMNKPQDENCTFSLSLFYASFEAYISLASLFSAIAWAHLPRTDG